MFTVPVLLSLTIATVVAAIACALALAAGASWPTALLSAGAGGLATLAALPRLLDPRDPD
ncbi:hypothetical protein HNP84_009467 [Thermocatellispora tengchongensis]|uniref:Uncharacterized protein n=1 Tax=Thermocatellispora tengchongensis TaxID=1073253 RepID=A0A840PNT1_9ACTN|nr:hypothetical protein [Thermocatellispora tengchongensis]MBB5139703.1 hypothetical protein [Thermocatellispora tengchongensis]